jgi:hypothetical protein
VAASPFAARGAYVCAAAAFKAPAAAFVPAAHADARALWTQHLAHPAMPEEGKYENGYRNRLWGFQGERFGQRHLYALRTFSLNGEAQPGKVIASITYRMATILYS